VIFRFLLQIIESIESEDSLQIEIKLCRINNHKSGEARLE